MSERVDVVVIGLGVGGEEVAGKLAAAGLSVLGVERRLVGGECPYWGCVPSKMMIRAANLLTEARRVDGLAGSATVHPDWAPVARRIRDEATDDWDDKVAVDRFTGKGGTFVRGTATIVGPGRVAVGDTMYAVERGIVIAAGTSAVVPPIDGLAGTPFWTNKEAIEVTTLPESLVVLGGGAIGLELAQVFARFGVEVTIVEAADRLIALEEPESSELAEKALTADGAIIRTGAKAVRVVHDGSGFAIHLDGAVAGRGDVGRGDAGRGDAGRSDAGRSDAGRGDAGRGEVVRGEKLLVAVGRRANVTGLGLETVGLDPKAHAVDVDERMRAGRDMWAVGDITGRGAFTHMAMYQAGIAIRDILGEAGPPADYRAVPRVTFTDPEIGAVGPTEEQAREAGIRVATGITPIPSSARGWIHKAGNEGFIKLVADADRGVLVGATSAGPVGGEVLSALSVAVHAEVPLATLRTMIYAYPTFHRAIETALAELG